MILFSVLSGGVFEQYRGFIATYDKSKAQARYLPVANELSKYKNYNVFYYEYKKSTDSFFIDELDAMFISLVLNKNTINGYSGNQPNGYWPMNNHRYDYWLNEGLLDFKNIKVLKYTSGTHKANIDTVYRTEYDIKFSSTNKPLEDYSFNIDLLEKYYSNIIDLTVINNGKVNWPSIYNGINGVALSYGVKDLNGTIEYTNRTLLPYDIEAGQKINVSFNIDGLKIGENEVCFNMVQDGVRWFSKNNEHCTIVIIK